MNFIQAYEKRLCSQAFHSEHQRYPKQSHKLPLLYKEHYPLYQKAFEGYVYIRDRFSDILKDGMLEKQKRIFQKNSEILSVLKMLNNHMFGVFENSMKDEVKKQRDGR